MEKIFLCQKCLNLDSRKHKYVFLGGVKYFLNASLILFEYGDLEFTRYLEYLIKMIGSRNETQFYF